MLYQSLAQFSEASSHTCVDELVSDPGDEAAQYARVFVNVELDTFAPRDPGELVGDLLLVRRVEGHGADNVSDHDALLLVVHLLEDLNDARQEAETLAPYQDEQQVHSQIAYRAGLHSASYHPALVFLLEVRVLKRGHDIMSAERRVQQAQIGQPLVEAVALPGYIENCLRIPARR